MTETTYNVLKPENGAPIKAWTKGVQLEDAARQQRPVESEREGDVPRHVGRQQRVRPRGR